MCEREREKAEEIESKYAHAREQQSGIEMLLVSLQPADYLLFTFPQKLATDEVFVKIIPNDRNPEEVPHSEYTWLRMLFNYDPNVSRDVKGVCLIF